MASKVDLLKELDFLTEQVSDRSRKIAFGLIAIWWAILIGDKHLSGLSAQIMLGPLVLAALSVLADFSQYAISYVSSRIILRKLEATGADTFQYNRTSFGYRTRSLMFYGKQTLAAAALVWFIVIIGKLII